MIPHLVSSNQAATQCGSFCSCCRRSTTQAGAFQPRAIHCDPTCVLCEPGTFHTFTHYNSPSRNRRWHAIFPMGLIPNLSTCWLKYHHGLLHKNPLRLRTSASCSKLCHQGRLIWSALDPDSVTPPCLRMCAKSSTVKLRLVAVLVGLVITAVRCSGVIGLDWIGWQRLQILQDQSADSAHWDHWALLLLLQNCEQCCGQPVNAIHSRSLQQIDIFLVTVWWLQLKSISWLVAFCRLVGCHAKPPSKACVVVTFAVIGWRYYVRKPCLSGKPTRTCPAWSHFVTPVPPFPSTNPDRIATWPRLTFEKCEAVQTEVTSTQCAISSSSRSAGLCPSYAWNDTQVP